MIAQWTHEVLNYIQQYMNHSPLPYIYLVSLVFLAFRGKEKRRMVFWPSVLIMLVILNPVCYGLIWTKLITYAFWRMLWMIPMLPVIACAVMELGTLCKKVWLAPVLTVAMIAVFFVKGDNLYQQPGVWTKAENAYKLPQATLDVGAKLLELEEEPIVIAPVSLYSYLRQYDGRIRMVYGRDAETYIQPIEDPEILELVQMMAVNGGDCRRFTELARAHHANLIVLPEENGFGAMEYNGYEPVATVDGYVIYRDTQ